MKYLVFRDADTGLLVSMVQVDESNPYTSLLVTQLQRAQALGLLDGVRTVQVAETDDASRDTDDLDWNATLPNPYYR